MGLQRMMGFMSCQPGHALFFLQVLLKAFIANLHANSPTVRRTAAGAVVSICQYSRRTQYFYSWLLSVLLGKGPDCYLLVGYPSGSMVPRTLPCPAIPTASLTVPW